MNRRFAFRHLAPCRSVWEDYGSSNFTLRFRSSLSRLAFYSPAVQSVQLVPNPSTLLDVPTSQGRHWVMEMLPVVGRYLPPTHKAQIVCSGLGLYFPVSQRGQEVAPAETLIVPGGQSKQADKAADGEYCPASQSTQELSELASKVLEALPLRYFGFRCLF